MKPFLRIILLLLIVGIVIYFANKLFIGKKPSVYTFALNGKIDSLHSSEHSYKNGDSIWIRNNLRLDEDSLENYRIVNSSRVKIFKADNHTHFVTTILDTVLLLHRVAIIRKY